MLELVKFQLHFIDYNNDTFEFQYKKMKIQQN